MHNQCRSCGSPLLCTHSSAAAVAMAVPSNACPGTCAASSSSKHWQRPLLPRSRLLDSCAPAHPYKCALAHAVGPLTPSSMAPLSTVHGAPVNCSAALTWPATICQLPLSCAHLDGPAPQLCVIQHDGIVNCIGFHELHISEALQNSAAQESTTCHTCQHVRQVHQHT
jgi:hypothetical protein